MKYYIVELSQNYSRTTIQAHPTSKYARGHSGLVSLGIFTKLVGSDKVSRQSNLRIIFLSFEHQVFDNLGSLLIKQRGVSLQVFGHLKEGKKKKKTFYHR